MSKKIINLENDCENEPTEEMRDAMRNARIGNDDHQEDPTINQLEKLAAEIVGKESALFCLSGTMANIIAIFTHCRQGDKIILEEDFHLYYGEIEGIKTICKIEPIYIESNKGIPDIHKMALELVKGFEDGYEINLICLENPHNQAGGIVTPFEITKDICKLVHSASIPVHLDGARIFNAAIALSVKPSVLCKDVDSVMFCLNKNLAAPVGAILAGPYNFIFKARQNRKMLGGHMRQMGIMAAAGIVGLEKMITRLKEDHENILELTNQLVCIKELELDFEAIKPQTNIVIIDIEKLGIDSLTFGGKLAQYNVICRVYPAGTKVRFVTHYGITKEDIDTAIKAIKEVIKEVVNE